MLRTLVHDPSELFAALSDRTRLRLVNLLRDGEVCVCDLVRGIDAPQPTVSRHLAVLRRAGFLTVRREGLWAHYRLADGASELFARLFECLRDCAAHCPEFPQDEKRMRAARESRGCCD